MARFLENLVDAFGPLIDLGLMSESLIYGLLHDPENFPDSGVHVAVIGAVLESMSELHKLELTDVDLLSRVDGREVGWKFEGGVQCIVG